jgi:hypothetical protein
MNRLQGRVIRLERLATAERERLEALDKEIECLLDQLPLGTGEGIIAEVEEQVLRCRVRKSGE